jgi:hypothetical protein
MLRIFASGVFFTCSTFIAPVFGQIAPFGPPEDVLKYQIIEECRAIYNRKQKCACPQDMEHRCSGVSPYERRTKRGAPAPFCNPADISSKVVDEFKRGVKTALLLHCGAKR